MASRALFTSSEGKNERGKNAGYEAEMRIFYPRFSRESKKNIQKENGKVNEFQNILREKCRINKTKQNERTTSNTLIISSLQDSFQ